MSVRFPKWRPYDKLVPIFPHNGSRSGLALLFGNLTSRICRLTSGQASQLLL